jgi:hypothetical protein
MTFMCRVETPKEFEQRVVRLQAEFAAGDAATRRRLLQPAHAEERFENYDPETPSLRQIAIISASVTSWAVIVAPIDQPTTRRENRSITAAA